MSFITEEVFALLDDDQKKDLQKSLFEKVSKSIKSMDEKDISKIILDDFKNKIDDEYIDFSFDTDKVSQMMSKAFEKLLKDKLN